LSVHESWAKFCIRFRPQLSLSSVTAADLHYLNTMYANGHTNYQPTCPIDTVHKSDSTNSSVLFHQRTLSCLKRTGDTQILERPTEKRFQDSLDLK